jgi:hypothetical protein
MVEEGVRGGPLLTAAAHRYGRGDAVTPPAELAFYILAKEFGVAPWEVAEAPLDEVARALAITAAIRKGEAARQKRSPK